MALRKVTPKSTRILTESDFLRKFLLIHKVDSSFVRAENLHTINPLRLKSIQAKYRINVNILSGAWVFVEVCEKCPILRLETLSYENSIVDQHRYWVQNSEQFEFELQG
jgi:hypothetical protein